MSKAPEIRTSGHFSCLLNKKKLAAHARHAREVLKGQKFDTFAFIGYSGAILSSVLGNSMRKELLMVRKNGGLDGSNSCYWIEGNHTPKRIIVVDDLIFSGRTMSQVMHAIRELKSNTAPDVKIVGLLLHHWYEGDGYKPTLFLPSEETSQFTMMVQSERMYKHPRTGEQVAEDAPPLY